jgi:hypothetical protein
MGPEWIGLRVWEFDRGLDLGQGTPIDRFALDQVIQA